MMKKTFALLLAFFVMQSSWSQQNFSDIDKWLDNNVEAMGGRLMLVVYKDGKVVYSHSENNLRPKNKMLVRMLAQRQGLTPDFSDYTAATRQQIASSSKWLSAALVMTFVDEGALKLTDTVGKFLPVLSRAGKGGISISQCLSHLTAIRSPDLKQNLQEMKKANNMDDAIAQIAAYPMEGLPGKVFRYSNTGLQIAGAVMEKISGKSFETLFAERIAAPLAMRNTDFGKTKVPLPAGGASSTPDDYLNFLVMIKDKGMFRGKRVLSENSVAEMQVNRITSDVKVEYTPAEAGGVGYGYGEWVMDQYIVSSPGLFGSYPWVDKEHGYAAFLMAFYLRSEGRQAKYVELKNLVSSHF